MEIKRRKLLTLSSSLILSSLLKPFAWSAKSPEQVPLYFSAAADSEGNYFLSGISGSGIEQFRLPLPSRGHGAARRPNFNQVAAFARRPGRYIFIVDTTSGEKIAQIDSLADRHFYGHGIYSHDGRWLFATESEYDTGRGLLGVYDAEDAYRLAETLPAHGIGPHEIALLADGKTIVVANGGILTHPETGREKLNLPEMDSSLAYIESTSGKLLSAQRLSPKLQLMSMRHVAVGSDDRVAVVMQYQGSRRHLHPLVGFQKGDGRIDLLSAPETVGYRMKNYCGSVAFDSSGKLLAVSSPRGGIITFWSVEQKCYLSHLKIQDGCGVAAESTPESFRITNGLGKTLRHYPLSKHTKTLVSTENTKWDNHLLFINT